MKVSRWTIVLTALNLAALSFSLALTSVRPAASATDDVPAVLRAQRIELIDSAGRLRARLNTEPDGEVVFRLVGANGELRVKLGASNDGAGLVLANQTTEPGVHILANRNVTFVKLVAASGRQRVIEP